MDDYLIETIEQLEALGESAESVKEFYEFYIEEIERQCQRQGKSRESIGYDIISILEDWSFIEKMQKKASALFKNLEYRRFDDSIEESDDLYCWRDEDVYGWKLYIDCIPQLFKTQVVSTREGFLSMLQETGVAEKDFIEIYKKSQEYKVRKQHVLGDVAIWNLYGDYAFNVYCQGSRYLIQTSSLSAIFEKDF